METSEGPEILRPLVLIYRSFAVRILPFALHHSRKGVHRKKSGNAGRVTVAQYGFGAAEMIAAALPSSAESVLG
jgi:hypothetical protein